MMSRLLLCGLLAAACSCPIFAIQASSNPGSIPASALALVPKPRTEDTLHIVTNVGSFKIVPKGEEMPSGRLEFTFSGTVLLTDVTPGSYLVASGQVTKQYDNPKRGKQVYFGNGKILLVGRFRNCEFFGRNLNFTFKGSGVVRITSEFDKKLQIGAYWFDPETKFPLETSMIPIPVPSQRFGPTPAITREEFNAQQKAGQSGTGG